MLIARMFGLAGATGLTLAFSRRMRALSWAGVGGVCLFILTRRTKQSNRITRSEDLMQIQTTSANELQTGSAARRPSHVAVILAHNLGEMGFGSPLPQVGAVPILLRSVLGAAKAGATRIVVVIDRVKGSRIVQDLLKTRRLPRNVVWCEVTSGAGFLPSLLGELASETDGHLVVIAGDRVYHRCTSAPVSGTQTAPTLWP